MPLSLRAGSEPKKLAPADNWARCAGCGHKLFKVIDGNGSAKIEVKCHSCKRICVINA